MKNDEKICPGNEVQEGTGGMLWRRKDGKEISDISGSGRQRDPCVRASRRVETLLPFSPRLTVHAPRVTAQLQKAALEGRLSLQRERYEAGSIGLETFLVLAATDDPAVNETICEECRRKGILVNACSDQSLCDFHFPGIASKGDLVIGVNAGGQDHHLAKRWTDRIRKEVEEDGFDDQTKTASDNGEASEDGT